MKLSPLRPMNGGPTLRGPRTRDGVREPNRGRMYRRLARSVLSHSMGRVVAPLLGPLALSAVLLGCGGGEVEDPVPLYGEIPIEYPLDLWDADVEGETLLRVRVNETGGVDSVQVLEASGYPAFDSAAVRGALQLEYSPARRNGNLISVWAKVPVHFTKSRD